MVGGLHTWMWEAMLDAMGIQSVAEAAMGMTLGMTAMWRKCQAASKVLNLAGTLAQVLQLGCL